MKQLLLFSSLLLIGFSTNFCSNAASKTDATQGDKAKAPETPDYSGTYEFSSETASGSVEIKNAADGQIEFELSVADQSGCTGDIFGTTAVHNGVATYNAEDCAELKFEFAENTVTISEMDCGFYHGMSCSFAGTYQKI